MTVIQKIKLRGFKSFANPTEIPFGRDFSIVLGPNGAGKSNIMDAFCFVLGKISAKSLRAEKSANLIFNGGKKGSPMKDAQVDIFFDNTKKEFPLDAQNIKISRIIRKSGSSIYKINDETRTRQQILELLANAKIDPDGHNIVLQGDIIKFTEMHPEQRRELIEEIAGISIYEDKKQKALSELQRVEEKLNNINIILNERKTYLRELKKERDQALRFKELEKGIKENKATFLHVQIKEKLERKAEIESRINKNKSLVQKINEKIEQVKKEISEKKDKIETINKEIEEKGEKSQLEIRENVGNLKTEIIRNSARLDTCNSEIKKIESRRTQLQTDLVDINSTIGNLQKTKKSLQEKNQDLKENEKKLLDDIQTFKEKHGVKDTAEIQAEIDLDVKNLEKNILELKEAISQIKQRSLKEILLSLEQKINTLIKKFSSFKKVPKETSFDDLKRWEQKKQSIRDQLLQIDMELKNIDTQLESIHLPEKENTLKILKQQEKEIGEFQEETKELSLKLKDQKEVLAKKEDQEKKFYSDYKNLFGRRNKISEELQKKDSMISSEDTKTRDIQSKINTIAIAKAKVTAELEALQKEFEEFKGVKLRKGTNLEDLKYEISKFERAKNEIGSVNLKALEIYDNVQEEYQGLLNKIEKLKLEKEDVLKMMVEIDSKKKAIFMETLNTITDDFKRIFSSLTEKGEAYLELENKEEPFKAGLGIKIKLIGNKMLDIKGLSGGEKTLAALAFIFAIQEYQPASFYLLDEVDAALDKRNSEKLSQLINKYARNAQYILISHNDAIISEANQIYGVSMQKNGISKVVSLKI